MYGYDEEVVTFSDEEWAAMMADPVYFGYSCLAGHAIREDDPAFIALGCPTCAMIGDASDDVFSHDPTDAEIAAFNRWADGLAVFPLVQCPHCDWEHVGEGAVRRCGSRR